MRFKTRLRTDRVTQLLRICQVLERVDRTCVLHLCAPDAHSVRLVVHADAAASLATFAVLKRSDWFEAYRIESQNANQIGLELDMHNFIRALRSAAAADLILVKLTKKGVPVLTFEISTPLGPILQDIPVVVLSAVRLAEFNEPQHDQARGLTLPPLTKLHTLVDRMKGLSQTLHLNAHLQTEKATLSLRVLTDMVSVSTTYSDLTVADYTFEDSQLRDDDITNEQNHAIVDLKNFSRCLYGHQVQPTHALFFIHPSCVMVHLMLPYEVTITYFIPRRASPT